MKQKGEFYKVKKSGFSMLLLLICVSMLSVMPVSAARKKSRYDLQFSDLKVNKKKLKAGEKCEIRNRENSTFDCYISGTETSVL